MVLFKKILNHLWRVVKEVYKKMIVKRHMEVNFWVLYMFLFAFVGARLTVYFFPEINLIINGIHVHHFAYGFILLAIIGFAALNDAHKKRPRVVGGLYGFSLGVAFDEFAMWIQLDDNYWVRQSYDAILVVGGFLVSAVYFSDFWNNLFEKSIDVLKKDIKLKRR